MEAHQSASTFINAETEALGSAGTQCTHSANIPHSYGSALARCAAQPLLHCLVLICGVTESWWACSGQKRLLPRLVSPLGPTLFGARGCRAGGGG